MADELLLLGCSRPEKEKDKMSVVLILIYFINRIYMENRSRSLLHDDSKQSHHWGLYLLTKQRNQLTNYRLITSWELIYKIYKNKFIYTNYKKCQPFK